MFVLAFIERNKRLSQDRSQAPRGVYVSHVSVEFEIAPFKGR